MPTPHLQRPSLTQLPLLPIMPWPPVSCPPPIHSSMQLPAHLQAHDAAYVGCGRYSKSSDGRRNVATVVSALALPSTVNTRPHNVQMPAEYMKTMPAPPLAFRPLITPPTLHLFHTVQLQCTALHTLQALIVTCQQHYVHLWEK
jgi:hypothetical protein